MCRLWRTLNRQWVTWLPAVLGVHNHTAVSERLAQREESIVDRITACQLIDLDHLVDALAWNRWRVDADTAGEPLGRPSHASPKSPEDERLYIDREIARRQL